MMATLTSAAMLAGAAACTSPSPPSRLIASGPAGYQLDSSASQQQLASSAVAQATPADPDLTKQALKRDGFTGASSRVWHASTGDFLLDLAVRFKTPSGAEEFRDFELAQIAERVKSSAPTASAQQAGIYPDSQLAGAKLFLLGGPNRHTAAPLFIEGIAFTSGETAYLVETGGPMPSGADLVERFAHDQASIA